MHIEIQVALNFVVSYLFNKLPRRRVNLFGEELEKAMRTKFRGHWYPEKPFRGSAYRCLRVGGDPLDPVLEVAARESGVELRDIRENLPEELSVWIDPGEVSYRIGEKGAVKVIYSGLALCNPPTSSPIDALLVQSSSDEGSIEADSDIVRSFNPEARCFKPIADHNHHHLHLHLGSGDNSDATTMSESLRNLAVSPIQSLDGPSAAAPSNGSPFGGVGVGGGGGGGGPSHPNGRSTSPPSSGPSSSSSSSKSPTGFLFATGMGGIQCPKPVVAAPPLTFTTATFAQTKFGSTKLKTNGKRSNRMSPTEFSNYIKQRAILQQQQQFQTSGSSSSSSSNNNSGGGTTTPPNGNAMHHHSHHSHHHHHNHHHHQHHQRPRSLSPNPMEQQQRHLQQQQQQHFMFLHNNGGHHHQSPMAFDGGMEHLFGRSGGGGGGGDLGMALTPPPLASSPLAPPHSPPSSSSTSSSSSASNNSSSVAATKSILEGINFNLNAAAYPSNHQHLLVAN